MLGLLGLVLPLLRLLMASNPTTNVAGTVASGLAAALSQNVATGTAATGTLAGLILNLQMATGQLSVSIVAEEIIRTPGLPAGALNAAEAVLVANQVADPVTRQEELNAAIVRLQAINTAAQQQMGMLSRFFASIGL